MVHIEGLNEKTYVKGLAYCLAHGGCLRYVLPPLPYVPWSVVQVD